MTKQELNRYFWLKNEIEKQKNRLDRLKHRMERSGETVGDTVLDYRNGKGIPVRIEGIPTEEFSLPIVIHMLEEEIEKNVKESEVQLLRIEQFIQSIEDPRMRELLRCRYLDCMSWKEIGRANYIDSDYARSLVRDFLKDCK